jgi:ABC-2 type transport system ATP-binding protein
VAQHSLREFIHQYNRDFNTTVILTSHYMDDIEALCERVLLIDEGSLLFDGELEELSKEFSAEKVLQLDFFKPINEKDIKEFGIVTECSPERVVLRINAENTQQSQQKYYQNILSPINDYGCSD